MDAQSEYEEIELRRITNMKKHPYQTCLRMPETLKEDMTTICTKHKINESDLMRRAIAEFVEKVNNTPESNSRYMFV